MGEIGCLKDGHFQNLSCEGKFMVHNVNAETVFKGDVVCEGDVEVNGQQRATTISKTEGGDIDTKDIDLATDHGEIFDCTITDDNLSIPLPLLTKKDCGFQITIIQNRDFIGAGKKITLTTAGGNTFSPNSYSLGYEGNPGQFKVNRPTDNTHNTLEIPGTATNGAWGTGSMIVLTCVSETEWHFAVRAEYFGLGSAGAAITSSEVTP